MYYYTCTPYTDHIIEVNKVILSFYYSILMYLLEPDEYKYKKYDRKTNHK